MSHYSRHPHAVQGVCRGRLSGHRSTLIETGGILDGSWTDKGHTYCRPFHLLSHWHGGLEQGCGVRQIWTLPLLCYLLAGQPCTWSLTAGLGLLSCKMGTTVPALETVPVSGHIGHFQYVCIPPSSLPWMLRAKGHPQ